MQTTKAPAHVLDRTLIAAIPGEAVVESASTAGFWARVTATHDGEASLGIAYCGGPGTQPWDAALSRVSAASASSGLRMNECDGRRLREVAEEFLLTEDLASRGLGLAALNAWYSAGAVARANGFVATGGSLPAGKRANWSQVFDPFKETLHNKTVAVIGRHPAAPSALDSAANVHILHVPEAYGEVPPAADYILPRCDVVFISGSAFVNGSAGRLIALAREAYCVVLGPSTPLAPALFDSGADLVAGIVADDVEGMDQALAQSSYPTMFAYGHRVHRAQPAGTSALD